MTLMGRRAPKVKPGAGELAPWLLKYLLHGTPPSPGDTPDWREYTRLRFFTATTQDTIAKAWRRHRETVRAEARALGVEAHGERLNGPEEAA